MFKVLSHSEISNIFATVIVKDPTALNYLVIYMASF